MALVREDMYPRGSRINIPPSPVKMAKAIHAAVENGAGVLAQYDVLNRSMAEGAKSAIAKGSTERVAAAVMFENWRMLHGAPKSDGGDPGLAVHTNAQAVTAQSQGWRLLDMIFLSPGTAVPVAPGVLEAEAVRMDVAAVRDFVRAFQEYATGEGDDGDGNSVRPSLWPWAADDEPEPEDIESAKISHLYALSLALPDQFQRAPDEESGEAGGEGGAASDDPIVPATINVVGIKTAGELFAFVEDGHSPLLRWGASTAEAVYLRKAAWGTRFAVENKKLAQLLAPYCYLRLTSAAGSALLNDKGAGNKQLLMKRANGLLGKAEVGSEFHSLKRDDLAEKYGGLESWWERAKRIYEDKEQP